MADKKEKPEIKKISPLIAPRISEKSIVGADKTGVYIFNVRESANKRSISAAVKETYKITPLRVRIARKPAKKVFVRGKWGVKKGEKKAYISLKKGDKIDIV